MSLLRQAASQLRGRAGAASQLKQTRMAGESWDGLFDMPGVHCDRGRLLGPSRRERQRPATASLLTPLVLTPAPLPAGNLPVKTNKFVEEWGTMREHVEKDFR